MKRRSLSRAASGTTAWMPLDTNVVDFLVGFAVTLGSGSLTYDIEHTYDDVFDSSVTPKAFKHSTLTGQTTDKDGSYATPISAIRLNITAYTSGTAVLTVLQSGIR